MRQFLINLSINLVVIYFIIAAYGSGANNHAEGVHWFEVQVYTSSVFVLILYFLQSFKYKSHLSAIILIEILSTITNLTAGLQYYMAHKTAYIYVHYGDIMTIMFLAELAIIMGALIRDVGGNIKHSALHLPDWHIATSITSAISIRKAYVCKIP